MKWQDVEPFNVEILGFWHRCYSAPEVEHARAADALEIAALRAENEELKLKINLLEDELREE